MTGRPFSHLFPALWVGRLIVQLQSTPGEKKVRLAAITITSNRKQPRMGNGDKETQLGVPPSFSSSLPFYRKGIKEQYTRSGIKLVLFST